MKKPIAPLGLIVFASLLLPVNTKPQQQAHSAPLTGPKLSVKFTGYNRTTGELKMAVRCAPTEPCTKMTVRLSPWNGTQIHGDTVMHEDLTGRKELSFVKELTISPGDTSGIVVRVSDTQEVMDAGLGRFGITEFRRFFVTTGDSLE
ncbi:MAG: hypothetical protein JSV52_00095, partial [Candidatus Zixiibacteriota bacterium]